MEFSQAVQNISPQQLTALLQSQTGVTALQGEEGGDFLAMLMQMLTGMTEEGDASLFPFLAGGQLSKDQEKNGSELAMQLMAGMLDPTALGMAAFEQPEFISQNSQMLQLIGSFAGVDSQKAQQLYLLMQAADSEAQLSSQGLGRQAGVEQPQAEQNDKGFLELLDYSMQPAGEASRGEESALQFGGSFRQAVAEAQKLLNTKDRDAGEEQAVDVESLQNLADTRREQIQQVREAAAREDMSRPQPLTEQIRTGVSQGLSEGKSEFTIKLKPEGLGEITVRLTEGTDGAMTLNLTASTDQTVKLLNQELASLREALRPYGTEVTPAVSQPQESAGTGSGYTGAQFDAQQGQQDFYGQQQGHGSAGAHRQDFVYDEEDADTETEALHAAGGLNAYI